MQHDTDRESPPREREGRGAGGDCLLKWDAAINMSGGNNREMAGRTILNTGQ